MEEMTRIHARRISYRVSSFKGRVIFVDICSPEQTEKQAVSVCIYHRFNVAS